jgi:hypothetical protein
LADVLTHFYCQDFSRIHLSIQKLDHATQFRRNHVSYEDQSHLACLEVCLHQLPALLGTRSLQLALEESGPRRHPPNRSLPRTGRVPIHWPIDSAIGWVFKQTNHFSTNAIAAAAAFHLHTSGNAVLIQEQAINRPSCASTF